MTIKSWKKEFYPVAAKKAGTSEITAVEHCLVKWKGARDKNLEKHGPITVDHYEFEIKDIKGAKFEFNSDTCALCVRHELSCENCSLAITLGNKSCFSTLHAQENGEKLRPFDIWEKTGDPEPMIKVLKKTLKRLQRKNV